jgi:hypothetical protein
MDGGSGLIGGLDLSGLLPNLTGLVDKVMIKFNAYWFIIPDVFFKMPVKMFYALMVFNHGKQYMKGTSK